MGQVQREEEKKEHELSIVAEIAIRTGLLSKCDTHDIIYYEGSEDFESAYKLATALIRDKDDLVDIFAGDRRRLTDLIQSIPDDFDHSDGCYECQRDWERIEKE